MAIEINHNGPENDHWIRLPKTNLHSSTINLQDHISSGKPGERIFIRSDFQTPQGIQKQWVASTSSGETVTINPNTTTSKQKIKLIYFCNCNLSKLYPKIVKHHLKDIRKSEMDQCENFSIIFVICGTHEDVKAIRRIAKRILPKLWGNNNISTHYPKPNRLEIRLFESSHFEHQGIRALWSESLSSDSNDILFYAHCKHITQISHSKKVSHFSKACSDIILRQLDTITSLLSTFESIDRAGISQGGSGWMWHNFFAAKASYLKQRPEPLMPDRYYYESWLAGQPRYEKNHKSPLKSSGLSMLTDHGISIGHLSTPEECNQLISNYQPKSGSTINHKTKSKSKSTS